MCGCAAHRDQQAEAPAVANRASEALSFSVEDMTCGHCAGTIKKAIETNLPGAQVDADPQTRIVAVRGASDAATVRSLIAAAGYTPSETLVAA